MKIQSGCRLMFSTTVLLGVFLAGSTPGFAADYGDETLGLTPESATLVCPDNQQGHAAFMRPDLAYSITGVDCFGDITPLPESGKIEALNDEMRAPASDAPCADRPHAHSPMLRPDLAYADSGRDCQGDAPSSASAISGDTVSP